MNCIRLVAITSLITASGLAFSGAPNLISNGNFELGNSGFSSSYVFAPGVNTAAGQYTITNNPSTWNSLMIPSGDHTSGAGLMFVANGSAVSGAVVWQSNTITISPATNYFFEAWVMNVCCIAPFNNPSESSPAILEFSINGTSVGIAETNLNQAGTWEGFSTTWNSGLASTAVLRLINRNTVLLGNDFAIDDISLSTTATIPEPAGFGLLLLGLPAVLLWSRRRAAHKDED